MYFLQDLKTHAICIKKKPQVLKKVKKTLKPMCLRCKYRRRDEGNAWNLAPRRPSDRTTVYTHTPSQLRLASPARTARTARTKRKRRRNEADLPVTGGRTGRTSSPKPPIYIYIYIYIYLYLLPIAYCLLHIAYCPSPIAYCLLPIAYCLLPVA